MTIVLCGGGSGGHITPLLAVAHEIRRLDPACKIVYVGEKRGKFNAIAEDSNVFDEYRYISAGKFRRYHNEPFLKRLFDIKTHFFNTRDVFRIARGTLEAILIFKSLKPQSVFLKGGYVCVPASIGAKLAGAFIVTHDSDALPGLSNRFAARFASLHATAMPTKYYNYPENSAREVGLPVDTRYKEYEKDEVRFLKEKYKIPIESRVLLVTGGSNGAKRLNNWVFKSLGQIFKDNSDLYVIMLVGKGNTKQAAKHILTDDFMKRLIVQEFSSELYHLSAIADVVITRAGATAITEFAYGSKACILVPNPDLTGGHQLKNAIVYEDKEAVLVVQEKDLKKSVEPLIDAVNLLLQDGQLRDKISKNLNSSLPKIPAAISLAEILVPKRKV